MLLGETCCHLWSGTVGWSRYAQMCVGYSSVFPRADAGFSRKGVRLADDQASRGERRLPRPG